MLNTKIWSTSTFKFMDLLRFSTYHYHFCNKEIENLLIQLELMVQLECNDQDEPDCQVVTVKFMSFRIKKKFFVWKCYIRQQHLDSINKFKKKFSLSNPTAFSGKWQPSMKFKIPRLSKTVDTLFNSKVTLPAPNIDQTAKVNTGF